MLDGCYIFTPMAVPIMKMRLKEDPFWFGDHEKNPNTCVGLVVSLVTKMSCLHRNKSIPLEKE
jgi:hypothetical protein